MALSNPTAYFGIHSFAPYDRDTREFKGILKVLGSSSLNFTGELIDLNGGSNKFPFATEDGLITAEISLVFREYPNFVFELVLGNAPTDNAAEASGNVGTIANANGTSLVDATTGIASVSAESGQESDLKFAIYVVKAVSATTVDVFASSDIDFARGDDLEYENDLLKITSSPITVPGTGGTVSIPNTGVEITGGSGAIALVTDDTGVFDTRPVNQSSRDVVIGGAANQDFPEFGAVVLAKKRSSGEMAEFDLYRVKAAGLPVGLEENTFSEASVTARALFDSTRDGVYKHRLVRP